MLHELPALHDAFERLAPKAVLQVMGHAVLQLARRIDDVRKEQRIPGRTSLGPLGRGLQRQDELALRRQFRCQQVRVEGIGNVIDVAQGAARLRQAVINGVIRQLPGRERHGTLAVFYTGEALFLGGSQHDAVAHQRGRAVVERRVDSQCVHKPPWPRQAFMPPACRHASGAGPEVRVLRPPLPVA